MIRFIGLLCAACGLATTAAADSYVNGYYRGDGTYVAPHYRSSPDGSYNNNYGVAPNYNPHTGEFGSRQPTWNNRAPSNPW